MIGMLVDVTAVTTEDCFIFSSLCFGEYAKFTPRCTASFSHTLTAQSLLHCILKYLSNDERLPSVQGK
jgi:hypothetical protein